MKEMLAILVSAIFVDNFVLSKFLGICPFLGVSDRLKTATGMSLAVTFVMVMATAVTWPIRTYLLDPNGMDYLATLVFILIIAGLVQLVEIAMKKYMPPLYNSLGIFLPLITTNCAVLGVTLLNFDKFYNYGQSLVNSLGAGIGFMVAMIIFSGVRERMAGNDIPKSLQGLPITLIAASIASLSFMGFQGLTTGLFG